MMKRFLHHVYQFSITRISGSDNFSQFFFASLREIFFTLLFSAASDIYSVHGLWQRLIWQMGIREGVRGHPGLCNDRLPACSVSGHPMT